MKVFNVLLSLLYASAGDAVVSSAQHTVDHLITHENPRIRHKAQKREIRARWVLPWRVDGILRKIIQDAQTAHGLWRGTRPEDWDDQVHIKSERIPLNEHGGEMDHFRNSTEPREDTLIDKCSAMSDCALAYGAQLKKDAAVVLENSIEPALVKFGQNCANEYNVANCKAVESYKFLQDNPIVGFAWEGGKALLWAYVGMRVSPSTVTTTQTVTAFEKCTDKETVTETITAAVKDCVAVDPHSINAVSCKLKYGGQTATIDAQATQDDHSHKTHTGGCGEPKPTKRDWDTLWSQLVSAARRI